jgi:hypothetical protein
MRAVFMIAPSPHLSQVKSTGGVSRFENVSEGRSSNTPSALHSHRTILSVNSVNLALPTTTLALAQNADSNPATTAKPLLADNSAFISTPNIS